MTVANLTERVHKHPRSWSNPLPIASALPSAFSNDISRCPVERIKGLPGRFDLVEMFRKA